MKKIKYKMFLEKNKSFCNLGAWVFRFPIYMKFLLFQVPSWNIRESLISWNVRNFFGVAFFFVALFFKLGKFPPEI